MKKKRRVTYRSIFSNQYRESNKATPKFQPVKWKCGSTCCSNAFYHIEKLLILLETLYVSKRSIITEFTF